jgi:hypothetical protein
MAEALDITREKAEKDTLSPEQLWRRRSEKIQEYIKVTTEARANSTNLWPGYSDVGTSHANVPTASSGKHWVLLSDCMIGIGCSFECSSSIHPCFLFLTSSDIAFLQVVPLLLPTLQQQSGAWIQYLPGTEWNPNGVATSFTRNQQQRDTDWGVNGIEEGLLRWYVSIRTLERMLTRKSGPTKGQDCPSHPTSWHVNKGHEMKFYV